MNRTLAGAAMAALLGTTMPMAAVAAPTAPEAKADAEKAEAPAGTGKLAFVVPPGTTLEVKVAGKKHVIATDTAPLELPAGETDVEIAAEGTVPTTGKVTIEKDRTLTLTPVLEDLPDLTGQETHGWIAFGTGVGLIVATIIIDQTVDFSDPTTRDALEWSMAGVGGSLTILGGVLLKDAWDSTNSPETKSVVYPTSLGLAPIQGGAMLSGGLSF